MRHLPTKIGQKLGFAAFLLSLGLAGLLGAEGDLFGKSGASAVTPTRTEVVAKAPARASTALVTEHVPASSLPLLPADKLDEETLWLARGIYSETKRPEEQELVAWVIRNRVETGYRGNDSFEEAVLDPYQFSAFNPGTRKRSYYSSLNASSRAPGFQRALSIAYHVRHSDIALRPFDGETRHFFSQRSMVGQRFPNWAHGKTDVKPNRYDVEAERFRFYAGIN